MAKRVFLEFEHDIEAFEKKVDELRELAENTSESAVAVSIDAEVAQLENKSRELLKKVYADLTPWQMSLVARHPNRPYTLDYIDMMFTDFQELHGDRAFADDEAIVGGLARLADMNVIVIGNQKGRTLRERTRRNFGMARPEGYRKALRLMKLAEKFGLPVITFVDTPGAYPGIDAEERGQSEAIGHNIYAMSTLNVPIVSCVIGEGGSGGALAIAVADTVMMLQYSTYSVISPEGCASILFKDAGQAPRAAEALALTAPRLSQLGLVAMPTLLARRAERLEGYGRFERLAEEVPEPEAPAAAPEAQPDAKADPCDCSCAKKAAQAAKSVKARPAAEEAKAAEAEKAE